METRRRVGDFAEYIAERYPRAVEIGIGHCPDIAIALVKKGVRVFGTDIVPFRYHGIRTVIDDITTPHYPLYRGVQVVYSMWPPVELVPFMVRLAEKIHADLLVKPLSDEYPGGCLTRYNETIFFAWQRT